MLLCVVLCSSVGQSSSGVEGMDSPETGTPPTAEKKLTLRNQLFLTPQIYKWHLLMLNLFLSISNVLVTQTSPLLCLDNTTHTSEPVLYLRLVKLRVNRSVSHFHTHTGFILPQELAHYYFWSLLSSSHFSIFMIPYNSSNK